MIARPFAGPHIAVDAGGNQAAGKGWAQQQVIDAAAANNKFPVPFLIGRPAAVLTPLFRHYAGMACHSPASARPPLRRAQRCRTTSSNIDFHRTRPTTGNGACNLIWLFAPSFGRLPRCARATLYVLRTRSRSLFPRPGDVSTLTKAGATVPQRPVYTRGAAAGNQATNKSSVRRRRFSAIRRSPSSPRPQP